MVAHRHLWQWYYLFGSIARSYGVNYKNYSDVGLNEVKRELATGNKLAIAWMKTGHFTKFGHYVVITGVETINGENYFTVYDPNAPNSNYDRVAYDGMIPIINQKYVAKVKAKTKIFASESISYHIFDVGENMKPGTSSEATTSKPVAPTQKPTQSYDTVALVENAVGWALEEHSKYKPGDRVLVPTKNGSVFMMTAWRGQTKIGRKAIFLIPDDPIGYMRANSEGSVQNVLEIISFLIGFTKLDIGKDALDFLLGKDIITGQEINRFILLGCIVAPEFVDQAVKLGLRHSDEIANLVMKEIKKYNDKIGGCFVAGTLISVKDDKKPIEEIKVGDYVWSENPETSEKGFKKVLTKYIHDKYNLINVYINDTIIETTEEHPFWVEGKGWVLACKLKEGDLLRLKSGANTKIKDVKLIRLKEPIKVYNFEVEDFHTYFVGQEEVLVHNNCFDKFADEIINSLTDSAGNIIPKRLNELVEMATIKDADKLTFNEFHVLLTKLQGKNNPGFDKAIEDITEVVRKRGESYGFKKLLTEFIGPPPSAMKDPHAHHILFKKGLGAEQQAAVKEGQALLRRYGIDPIMGKENLVWAPNRVPGQHDITRIRYVVDELKKIENAGGDYNRIVQRLRELGKEAANVQ